MVERPHGLRNNSQLNRTRKELRSHHRHGHDLYQILVRGREQFQIPLRDVDIPLVVNDASKAVRNFLALGVLSAVEGDAFGILADSDEEVAEVSFVVDFEEVDSY